MFFAGGGIGVFCRDFFAFDEHDYAAILEYASGKWWSRR